MPAGRLPTGARSSTSVDQQQREGDDGEDDDPDECQDPGDDDATGTRTTMSWDTAAIQVPARIPGEP